MHDQVCRLPGSTSHAALHAGFRELALVGSVQAVVTPPAGPILFSFVSQCLTAPSDAAYLNNVLFFSELALLSSCGRLLRFSRVRSTATFYAVYIQNALILHIARSDFLISPRSRAENFTVD